MPVRELDAGAIGTPPVHRAVSFESFSFGVSCLGRKLREKANEP